MEDTGRGPESRPRLAAALKKQKNWSHMCLVMRMMMIIYYDDDDDDDDDDDYIL